MPSNRPRFLLYNFICESSVFLFPNRIAMSLSTTSRRCSSRRRTPTVHYATSFQMNDDNNDDDDNDDNDFIPETTTTNSSKTRRQRPVKRARLEQTNEEKKSEPLLLLSKQKSSSSNWIDEDKDKEDTIDLKPTTSFTSEQIHDIRHALHAWYMKVYRKFPWRLPPRAITTLSDYEKRNNNNNNIKNKDDKKIHEKLSLESNAGMPYAIWISEVMSQQTRIEVVIEYFKKWMLEFPTLKSLSESNLERVNELWSGLGYYRRAKYLYLGSRQVMSELNGTIPNDIKTLKKIKGIGPYTAGAIASIAYGTNTACVDGNINRVISRLLPNNEDVWKIAQSLLEQSSKQGFWPGDLNQALMELGATICKPRTLALCHKCPLQPIGVCGAAEEAKKMGISIEDMGEYVSRYPVQKQQQKNKTEEKEQDIEMKVERNSKGTKIRYESVIAVVAWTIVKTDDDDDDDVYVLLMQRPMDGLLAGLWEVANVIITPTITTTSYSSSCVDKIEDKNHAIWCKISKCCQNDNNKNNNIQFNSIVHAGKVVHIFSHIKQQLDVYVVRVDNVQDVIREKHKDDVMINEKGSAFRWLSIKKELAKAAISTQMKKVLVKGLKKINVDIPQDWEMHNGNKKKKVSQQS